MPEPDPIPVPVVPIPEEYELADPTPVEAIPVESMQVEPVPAATAQYRSPAPPPPYPSQYSGAYSPTARPGIITAIGVSSIVVASICLVGGLVMIMVNTVVSSVARLAVPAAPTTPASMVVGPAELLGPNGTADADRAVIVDGIGQVRQLNDLQRQQLDELLAEEGKSVLPLSGPNLTVEQVVANVTRSGHLSAGGTSGTEYFDLGNGRLELTDDRAVFFPTNGQPAIRANAIAIPPSTASVLQPDQIRSVIRAVNRTNIANIKSAQATALIQTLQGPGQQLIAPTTDGSDPANQVTAVSTDPDDGSLTLSTRHGTADNNMVLDASGRVTSTFSSSTSLTSTSFSTSVTASGGRGPGTSPNFNRAAAQWMSFISMVQLGLAIYLLICGIFMLRTGNVVGRRMHWIYLLIKLPVAIAACGVAWWLWSGVFSSVPAAGPSGNAAGMAVWFTIPGVIGMIYPVVLLFVLLLSQGVRTYFSAARYAA